MFNPSNYFEKDNLDKYLKELGKEYRRLNGTAIPAEIILIGGAAIIANYGFREMTTDIDAIIHAASSMKDAVNKVGDRNNLPNGWLNSDFMHTSSYSDKLDEVSVYYKTFSNVLTVRTVSAEYLIAMKLRSGRKYKNDLSDIVGILYEHQKNNNPIEMGSISVAVEKLYGGWEEIPKDSKKFIKNVFEEKDFERIYNESVAEENKSNDILKDFEKDYPNVARESNVDDILSILKARKDSKV